MEKRSVLIYGASQGLGRYLFQRMEEDAHYTPLGISRKRPNGVDDDRWITADLANPLHARSTVIQALGNTALDTVIYNVGVWEELAFEPAYNFLNDRPEHIHSMVQTNISSCILQIHALLPKLLKSERPHIVFTGSTSALDNTGRPEVTFNASKFALRGIAQALRAGFRQKSLAVTVLNLGYLQTETALQTEEPAAPAHGNLLPLEDVWKILHTLLNLSTASCPLEVNLPAMLDTEC